MNTHRSFRSAMTWLHTWAGLLLGWVLFAIFVTGTAAYFRPEITAWMQPEVARSAAPVEAARHAFGQLQEAAPESDRWLISVPDGRQRELTIHWKDARNPKARFEKRVLDPSAEGRTPPRETFGGEFFYRFHFQLMLPYPWGRYLACVAAMFMLVALVSGIFTHRRFFKDMFLLRLGRDGRRPWLDFHNVTAVLALPFYLMISYSALVIFTPMLIPLATKILAPEKTKPVAAASANPGAETARAAAPETTPAMWVTTEAFDAMLARVDETWGAERSLRRIEFNQRGTPKATVTFTRVEPPKISYVFTERETLKFSALTGDLIEDKKPAVGMGTRIRGVFYGLHLAHFAGPVLRTLFFLMGIMGAAMVGTGLVLWTLKRKERLTQSGRGGRFGYRLVSRLNITAIAGFPLACAAFFWANRLLPAGLAGRDDLEVDTVLIVWGVAALHAFARPERSGWREQLWAGAFAFGALPLLDLLTVAREVEGWLRFDARHVGFAVAFIALAALFGYAARKLSRRDAAATKGTA